MLNYYKENFNIGGVCLRNNILLAPLAGVSDRAFRVLCSEYGAGLTFTEMISAKGVHYGSEKSVELAALDPAEKPAAVQIFGSEPEIMAEAASLFVRSGASLIDINMGCPMPKITSNGDGSALMNDPVLAEKIVSAVTKAVSVPVTVKMRRGYDSKLPEQAVELALACQSGGASMVTVHGRFRDQLYSGVSDWGVAGRVKAALSIPVIGNGDIKTPEDVKRIMELTGCDGVMIGRAAFGAPWIFDDIKRYFLYGDSSPVQRPVKETMLRQLDMTIAFKGEYVGLREMRNHMAWYLKGLHGSAALKNNLLRCDDAAKVREMINEYFTTLES